jgi:hypothetical protein
LTGNWYYFILLGALYLGLDDEKARENNQCAYELAFTQADKQVVRDKMNRL